MAARSAISLADSPLVCTVGTLAAVRLMAVVRVAPAVGDLTVVPDLAVKLADLLVVVSVVLEGALVAVDEVTAVDTDAPRDGVLGEVNAPEEAAEDELAEARTGDTIDAPGVSDEAEVPWPTVVDVHPATAVAATNTSPTIALRRIEHPP